MKGFSWNHCFKDQSDPKDPYIVPIVTTLALEKEFNEFLLGTVKGVTYIPLASFIVLWKGHILITEKKVLFYAFDYSAFYSHPQKKKERKKHYASHPHQILGISSLIIGFVILFIYL